MDVYTEYYYLGPVISFLFVAGIIAINYWDATPLENKLMTNFKKIQITCSKILIESVVFSIFFHIFIFMKEGKYEMFKTEDLGIIGFLPYIINLLTVSLGLSIIFNAMMFLCKKLLMIKYHYYVNIEGSDEKWYLIRKSNKNQVLLRNENGGYLFLDEWNKMIFNSESALLNKVQSFLFTNKKRFNKVVLTLLLSIITLYFLLVFIDLSTIESIVLQLSVLFLFMASAFLVHIEKHIFKEIRSL